jgi:hypothetical protein
MIGVDAPSSVLDFGVGNGQYGLHVRQVLDISQGRLYKDDWKVLLEGIEVFPQYHNPIWDYAYNKVHITDGHEFLKSCERKFDLIIMCDVIEHFERDVALNLIQLMRAKARTVLITTPHGAYPQGAAFGNQAECHRSEWYPQDFDQLGAVTRTIATTFLAVFSDKSETLSYARHLPALYRHTGRGLAGLALEWLPRMIKSRTSRIWGSRPRVSARGEEKLRVVST